MCTLYSDSVSISCKLLVIFNIFFFVRKYKFNQSIGIETKQLPKLQIYRKQKHSLQYAPDNRCYVPLLPDDAHNNTQQSTIWRLEITCFAHIIWTKLCDYFFFYFDGLRCRCISTLFVYLLAYFSIIILVRLLIFIWWCTQSG